MIIKKNIDIYAPLTEEQETMLKKSAAAPIVFDEDCQELSAEELSEFKRVSDIQREGRRKGKVEVLENRKLL